MARTTPTLIVSVGLALAPVVMLATPVSAATLPDGDTLFTISCDWGKGAPALYELDGDTALATPIGPTGHGDCAGPAAFDPTTGLSYMVSSTVTTWTLNRVDVGTGAASTIVSRPNDSATPISIAIGLDGAAYSIGPTNLLHSIDLSTGATTLLGGPITPLGQLGDFIGAFAVDPTSGEFYGISNISGNVYRIDVAVGAGSLIGNVVSVNPDDDDIASVYGLQIDTSGRWWMTVLPDQAAINAAILFSSDLPDGDTPTEAEGTINTSSVVQELLLRALLLTYPVSLPSALPATGALPTWPVAIGAMLVILGAALVTVRGARPRRTRSTG